MPKNELYSWGNLDKIKTFLCDLITALSDERYINILKEDEKVFLYEDIKSDCIFMISEDFIKHIIHSFNESNCIDNINKYDLLELCRTDSRFLPPMPCIPKDSLEYIEFKS
ncbi:hypothetical protein RF11_05130 [Thelohanellus kitauei]|uniref:Uncharacterized protein n=1 Tax=Thelohanellus kitauei TaxID=669202 RepID=A0A0C2IPW5_THEKT|nr:hypothetical protein RF11_05130 [Thelohanellus kitauei]